MTKQPTLSSETDREFNEIINEHLGEVSDENESEMVIFDPIEVTGKLKQFIAKVEQRAEEREREKIINEVDNMPFVIEEIHDYWNLVEQREVIRIIKSLTPPTINERKE